MRKDPRQQELIYFEEISGKAADFRYHILQKEKCELFGKKLVAYLFYTEELTISLRPLGHPLECRTFEEFRNLYPHVSISDSSSFINHENERIIKIVNLMSWFSEVKNFLGYFDPPFSKPRLQCERLILHFDEFIKEERYRFFNDYTTIYEAALIFDLLELIYIKKIIYLEPDLSRIRMWLIHRVGEVRDRFNVLLDNCTQPRSHSFINLSEDIREVIRILSNEIERI